MSNTFTRGCTVRPTTMDAREAVNAMIEVCDIAKYVDPVSRLTRLKLSPTRRSCMRV